MTSELLNAAREYAVANDRYHAACRRLDIARGKQNVPREEWDEATVAACKAVNDAQRKLFDACERLFPQTEANAAWKEYSARFWPSEQDRRCSTCQTWLDRYGNCPQCRESEVQRENEP